MSCNDIAILDHYHNYSLKFTSTWNLLVYSMRVFGCDFATFVLAC